LPVPSLPLPPANTPALLPSWDSILSRPLLTLILVLQATQLLTPAGTPQHCCPLGTSFCPAPLSPLYLCYRLPSSSPLREHPSTAALLSPLYLCNRLPSSSPLREHPSTAALLGLHSAPPSSHPYTCVTGYPAHHPCGNTPALLPSWDFILLRPPHIHSHHPT
jgi:hypothetical protein